MLQLNVHIMDVLGVSVAVKNAMSENRAAGVVTMPMKHANIKLH